ncbi:MAG TPA: hypothetical protein VM493_08695 [Vicinamibacterales bacterium]|nr:hypothetical protein [Vicinamibacterales bacterium]
MSDMPANGSLKWRLERAEADIKELEMGKASTRDLDKLSEEYKALASEFKSVTRALYLFSLTVAAAGVSVAFAVLQGGH